MDARHDAQAGFGDRRSFLRRTLARLVAPLAILCGVPGLAAVLDPARRRARDAWTATGVAEQVVGADPVRASWTVSAGWETRRRIGYLVREGETLVALSARCTHAGCTVRADAGGFACPCHGGRFARDGTPQGGPVSRPLERLACRVSDGMVEVRSDGA